MAGYFNTDIVKEGTAFNRAEIEGAMKRQGVKAIEKGDVVLFYTGWVKLIGKDDKRYNGASRARRRGCEVSRLPQRGHGRRRHVGPGSAALREGRRGVRGPPDPASAQRHFILENMNTEELVKDQAWEFLFTLGPSRITGAVQAIINPIAIK